MPFPNMLALGFLLLLSLPFFVRSHSPATLTNDTITYERREKNLAWPLPDLADPGQLIYHIVHCFIEMQKFEFNGPNARGYRRHCRAQVAKTLQYLQRDPKKYRATKWVCDLLETNWFLSAAHYQTFDTFDFYQEPTPGLIHPDFLKATKDENPIALAKTQYAAHVILETRNFADLLRRNASDEVSPTERTYLSRLEDDHGLGFQALGLYCGVGGQMEEVRLALSKSGTVDDDPVEGMVHGPPPKAYGEYGSVKMQLLGASL